MYDAIGSEQIERLNWRSHHSWTNAHITNSFPWVFRRICSENMLIFKLFRSDNPLLYWIHMDIPCLLLLFRITQVCRELSPRHFKNKKLYPLETSSGEGGQRIMPLKKLKIPFQSYLASFWKNLKRGNLGLTSPPQNNSEFCPEINPLNEHVQAKGSFPPLNCETTSTFIMIQILHLKSYLAFWYSNALP